ncbi:MAG TPA: lysylphosphatidylglycerol synthase transmembrane domain-containing protein [Solirubrobacteraceae bacterium]|jgi:hypothetical protein
MPADAARADRPRLQRTRRIVESVWVRVFVTVALLGVVASRIDWARLGTRLRHGHPLDFVVAVALVLASLVVGIWRWRRLLIDAGVVLPVSRLVRVYAIAIFSGTFLPTTVGGDVTRTLLIARRGPTLTRVSMSVLVDRAGGLVGMIGIAWIAFAAKPASVPANAQAFLTWATVAIALASGVALVAVLRGSALIRRVTPERMRATLRHSRALIRSYVTDPALLVVVLVSSLAFQALVALQLVFLGRAIDVHLPFATAAVALALVTIVTLIPVSIGGFGVREGTYVILLGAASIGATDATLISLLSVAALFLASLPGAFFLAHSGLAPALHEVA